MLEAEFPLASDSAFIFNSLLQNIYIVENNTIVIKTRAIQQYNKSKSMRESKEN